MCAMTYVLVPSQLALGNPSNVGWCKMLTVSQLKPQGTFYVEEHILI